MFEVLIIIVVLLVVFGAGKVRGAGSDLGAAVKGFRKALSGPQRPPRPSSPPDAVVTPADTRPDAEFPEVLAARARRSGKPGA